MSHSTYASYKPPASEKNGTGPAWTLLVLAPVISELLSGSTRLSTILALVPEIMLWGCGTLLIREIAKRRNLGWISLLLMGLALSIAEEFVIQQTSLAPLPFPGARVFYGRYWGVNWLYFLFMLGYESVWVVLVPVQLTELIFRGRRNVPWLQRRGLIIAGLAFVLGIFVAWYGWVKRVRPLVLHVPPYQPPLITIAIGLLSIGVLIAVSLRLRTSPRSLLDSIQRRPLPPGVLGALAVLIGLPWYLVIFQVFTTNQIPFELFITAAIGWASLAFFLFRHLAHNLRDMHRYALTFGAILVCIIGGFAGSRSWPRIDLIGKIVLDGIALILLIALGRKLNSKQHAPAEPAI
jgi:hypothetical protein